MNEELLQLAYSKFETDADYDTFKADLLANEDLQKMAYAKFETDADFETFRSDLLGEKKKPSESSGESLEETGDSDSFESPMVEDGVSDSPELRPISDLYDEDDNFVGLPNAEEKKSYLQNIGDNLMAGMNDFNKMVTSIPETIYDVFALPQNAIAAITGAESLATSSKKFKENMGVKNSVLDYYVEEGEKIDKEIQEFNQENYESSSIYENIQEGNYGDAFELLGSGITRSAPVSLSMMVGGATMSTAELAAVSTAAFTGAKKLEVEESDPNASEFAKTIKAIGLAGAESVFMSIGTGTMGAVYKDIIKKEGAEVGADIFRKGLIESYKGALKKYGVPAGALGEGIEEVATQITQNMINGAPMMEGVADAFILGVGSGTVMTAPISAKNAMDNFNKKLPKKGTPEDGTVELNIPAVEEKQVSDEDINKAFRTAARPALETESIQELKRIKDLPAEAEDGATFNQDGSKFEGKGLVIPVTSKNFTAAEFTPTRVRNFIKKNKEVLGTDNVKIGFYKFPNSDQISVDINIVADPSVRDVALAFGKESGQESLFDLETFENIKTGADGKNPKQYTPEQFKQIAKDLAEGKTPDIQAVTIDESGVDENVTPEDTDIENIEQYTPEKAAEKSKELADVARAEQRQSESKNLSSTKRAINKAVDILSDRQGSVKRIIKKAGMNERVIDYMVAKLGASSYAKNIADKAHARTFDRLSQEDSRTLEEIILNRRTIAIDNNRAERGLEPVKHQGGITKEFSEKALEGYRKKLGDKKYNELVGRADAFFDEYKSLLKTMRKEGLIDQATYDIFAEVDYQPRVYLDFLKDMEGNFMNEQLDNFETSTLSQEQIKSMKGGSEGSQSMDSQGLLQRSIMARAKAVFSNRVNKAFAEEFEVAMKKLETLKAKETLTKAEEKQLTYLKELDDNVRADKIVGWSETTGKPKYAMEKTNKDGWKAIYYYTDGTANRIWMKQDFHEKFTDTNNQILNASSREVASKVSGTRLVKTMATGENPLFLITNVPRDLAFALTFSKEYGNGYKTIVPVELVKLLRDFGKGAGQALAGGKLYDKYMEYGGGMDFLTVQGRYGKEGIFNRYVENSIADKFVDFKQKGIGRKGKDFLAWIRKVNTASEFATRIAVFDRSIQNQLKKIGVKDINSLTEEKQADIYTKAVRSARELSDFNQGGKATKALDAAVPYLNAATQGTRAAVQNTVDRPVETTFRILQVAGGFTALTMTAAFSLIGANRDEQDEEAKNMSKEEIYFETLKGVSPYDLRNYYIFPTGVKNSQGEWGYYRVAKAQSLSPFINTAEHYLRKFYAEKEGIEYKQDLAKELSETVNQNVMPIGYKLKDNVGRVPLVDAYVATLGIDAYTENPLDWKTGKIPKELEGIVDDRVEGFYKKIGEEAGVSPVRLKSAIESFITTPSTNPYVGLAYMGAEYMTVGEKKDAWAEFKKAAGKRVFKHTSEYNRISKVLERVNKDVVDVYAKHIKIEHEVRKAVKQAKIDDSVESIDDTLNKIFKDNPEMAKQAVSWAKSEFDKKKLNPLVSSLKFERNKEVRAIILAEKFGDSLLKSENTYTDKEKAVVKELIEEKVLDAETYKNYQKLVKK